MPEHIETKDVMVLAHVLKRQNEFRAVLYRSYRVIMTSSHVHLVDMSFPGTTTRSTTRQDLGCITEC